MGFQGWELTLLLFLGFSEGLAGAGELGRGCQRGGMNGVWRKLLCLVLGLLLNVVTFPGNLISEMLTGWTLHSNTCVLFGQGVYQVFV